MHTHDIWTIALVSAGAVVMGLALYRTMGVLMLLKQGPFSTQWRLLLVLMGLFLAGYITTAILLISGYNEFMVLLTGIIFFFGAVFVYLVVLTGKKTIRGLIETTVSKEALEAVNASLLHTRKVAEKAKELAFSDSLTQLPNRRLIEEYLDKFIAGIHRHQHFGAILLIDLDGFKEVNDTYGHEAGDVLLTVIAKRLKQVHRAEDIVARIGGDEFVSLIHSLGNDEKVARKSVSELCKRIIRLLSEEIQYQGHTLRVGASIGIRLLSTEAIDKDQALREADCALYGAKNKGKGQALFYGD